MYTCLPIKDGQNDKGKNIGVNVNPLSAKQVLISIQWEDVTFPDKWNIDIKPTLANERIMPRTLTSQCLGNTDQYQIVSTRSLPLQERKTYL